MSFPNMTGTPGGSWVGNPHSHRHPAQSSPQPPPLDESGLQTRHMGLKVQYTFEKDQQNCLAKWPHALQIQTIPLDERTAIGLVDLRICLQAIAQCSPEIIHQQDKDYAVYALDYAEEDTPLVGQGMLSWGLEQPGVNTEQKLVTGRVVKNMLAALRGGPPETLEVKLKLNGVPRMQQRPQTSHNSGGYGSNAPTPTATDSNSEWNSFVQSNPNFGGSAYGAAMSSPGFPPVGYGSPIQQAPSPAPDARMDVYAPQLPVAQRNAPTPPTTFSGVVSAVPRSYFPPVPSSQGLGPEDAVAYPEPRILETIEKPVKLRKKTTASSTAPRKKKASTNPVGRPKTKKRVRPDMGNTSAIEEATDADEAPAEATQKRTTIAMKAVEDATDADDAMAKAPKKKKAKTTKANRPSKAPPNSAMGNTSAIDDGTDADEAPTKAAKKRTAKATETGEDAVDAEEAMAEGPKKKRAKTTKADRPSKAQAPLNSAPGSLRVAASTSGSLRTMRPPASGETGLGASHLQEIPRAPTPVPGQLPSARGKVAGPTLGRRSSIPDFEGSSFMVSETGIPGHSALDAVSPSDSTFLSPYNAYTPDESQADIGSSPPVPRSALSVQSSPPLSSPELPMRRPMLQPDSGFMSGGLDEMMDDYDLLPLPPLPSQPMSSTLTSNFPQPRIAGKKKLGQPLKAAIAKAVPPSLARSQTARPASRGNPRLSQNPFSRSVSGGAPGPVPQMREVPLEQMAVMLERKESVPPSVPDTMNFQHEVPGDPQLLPKETIYTRPVLAKAPMKSALATGTIEDASRSKRANTEPTLQRQETHGHPSRPPPMAPSFVETPSLVETLPTEPGVHIPEMRVLEFHQSRLPQQGVEQVHQQQIEQTGHKVAEAPKPGVHTEVQKPEVGKPEVRGGEFQEPRILEPRVQELEAQVLEAQLPDVQLSETNHEQHEQVNQELMPSGTEDSPADKHQATATAPTPTAPSFDETEALVQLLSGPVEHLQHKEPELPTMPPADAQSNQDMTQSADSETVNPTFFPPAPTSELGVLDPSETAGSASFDAINALTKNMSRKKSIKEKLEKAVQAGKMPTFCSNCGSISTPTWRKIWTQDSDGSPDTTNFSEEPGHITATIILETDEDGKTIRYRTVKKTLGPGEDKSEWNEETLCNPCGLWFSKFRAHRPESKWEADFAPKTRDRAKGAPKPVKPRPKSKPKKRKGQSTAPAHPTSEAYFTTDPIGPDDQGPSPGTDGEEVILLRAQDSEPPSRERGARSQAAGLGDPFDTSDRHAPSESDSSAAMQSHVAAPEEDAMGQTRRLLFPSPKKDGQVKVLGEVAVNIVRTSGSFERAKAAIVDIENASLKADVELEMSLLSTPKIGGDDDDDLRGLFGTPARPSTPPPKERVAGSFKTPTRPTPSHRPITRSVSRSIRRSTAKSPGQALSHIHQTPIKTPRSSARRRDQGLFSASNAQHSNVHFAVDESFLAGMSIEFDSPFNATLNQLLSEANDFTAGSDAHGLADFELPVMESDTGLTGHLDGLDFGHFLTTDAVMPSSPPLMMGRDGTHMSFEASEMDFSDWGAFGDLGDIPMDGGGREELPR